MIWVCYSEANNKLLKLYYLSKPSTYIAYLDASANSLYGHSLMQLLPIEILDWVNPKKFNVDHNYHNSSRGYFIEAGLDYSEELNNLHDDYPLAPEKINVAKEMLSDY